MADGVEVLLMSMQTNRHQQPQLSPPPALMDGSHPAPWTRGAAGGTAGLCFLLNRGGLLCSPSQTAKSESREPIKSLFVPLFPFTSLTHCSLGFPEAALPIHCWKGP